MVNFGFKEVFKHKWGRHFTSKKDFVATISWSFDWFKPKHKKKDKKDKERKT